MTYAALEPKSADRFVHRIDDEDVEDRRMRAWVAWAAGMAIAQAACATHAQRAAAVSGAAASEGPCWRYEVVADERSHDLAVDAWLPRGSLADLVVRSGAEPFVEDARVDEGSGWRRVAWRGAALHVPECAHGCHVRYRFALRRAAEALRDIDLAIAWGDVVEASPSLWLAHPALAPPGARYRFHVRTPAGVSFATGVFTAGDAGADTYEADASNLGVAPYAAFGPLRVRRVEPAAGSTVVVAIAPADYVASDDALAAWVAHGARTMARFFGCFPVERAMVLVVPARGARVRHGETMGDGGASIVVEVGEQADARALAADWVLPHEMAHLAVPSVARQHHWIEEGVAVYVEPVARARAGEIPAAAVWREFARGMPMGAAARGAPGLDDASDWARTYWGGAAFCLAADVAIRERTGNRAGFEQALRGVLASGGSVAQIWDFGRLLATADASVGVSVLRPLRRQVARAPWSIDLPRLFRALGVVSRGDDVVLADDAPLAAVRRAITEPLDADAPEPTACRWTPATGVAER